MDPQFALSITAGCSTPAQTAERQHIGGTAAFCSANAERTWQVSLQHLGQTTCER